MLLGYVMLVADNLLSLPCLWGCQGLPGSVDFWPAINQLEALGCEISQPELLIATNSRSDTLNSSVGRINSDQSGETNISHFFSSFYAQTPTLEQTLYVMNSCRNTQISDCEVKSVPQSSIPKDPVCLTRKNWLDRIKVVNDCLCSLSQGGKRFYGSSWFLTMLARAICLLVCT